MGRHLVSTFELGLLLEDLKVVFQTMDWGHRESWTLFEVRDEGSCTKRGWSLYQIDQSVEAVLGTAVTDVEPRVGVEIGIDMGWTRFDMVVVAVLLMLSLEPVTETETEDLVADRMIVVKHWM